MNPYSHLLVSLAVGVVAAIVIFGMKILAAVKAPFQRFSRWMKGSNGTDGARAASVMKLRKGALVEFKGHRGGLKWGTVVASRNRGLHGQARVSGPGKSLAWRSWAKLEEVR